MERGHAELPCFQPDVGQLGARPGGSPRALERSEGGGGIVAVGRVEGIVRREDLRGIQRIVRRMLTGLIEDFLVALVLLREACSAKKE